MEMIVGLVRLSVASLASHGKSYNFFLAAAMSLITNFMSCSLPAHHPCPLPCHAPSSCSESTPCQSIISLTCPCGRIQQPAQCSRSASSNSSASSSSKQIKCTNECAIAKRNARLADALGINTETREKSGLGSVAFGDDLVTYTRVAGNGKFVALVEKTFAE
jgi:transcriptional repressor NF-X1